MKSAVPDINAKKLQHWITKIKLVVNESTRTSGEAPAATGDDEEEEVKADTTHSTEAQEPITAIVRIRIPKKQPELEKDEDGNEVSQEINEEDLVEMPIEDKCFSVATSIGGQNIYCIN